MAELGWAVLCRRSINEAGSNLGSLIDTVDALQILQSVEDLEAERLQAIAEGHKGLAIPIQLALVTWWFRSDHSKPEASEASLAILDPDGRELHRHSVPVELRQANNNRVTTLFRTFPYSGKTGVHWFVVEKVSPDGGREQVARHPFDVAVVPPTGSSEPAQRGGKRRSARRR